MNQHLDPLIVLITADQDQKEGFSIADCEPGTRLTIETHNSVYDLEIVNPEKSVVTVMGGTTPEGEIRFEYPTSGTFLGCSWGGSILKPRWFGEDMRMEIQHGKKTLNTSPIRNVSIQHPNQERVDLGWKTD